MPLRAHLVEYHACYADVLSEIDKPRLLSRTSAKYNCNTQVKGYFLHFSIIISFYSAKVQNYFVTLPINTKYMQVNIQHSMWYDRIWAAFIFFTRLPFWRLHEPSKDSYNAVVEYWPLTGWLTGGLMAATLWVSSLYLPYMLAVLLAIMVRLLITGALHEDGLADFLDGFGGGGSSRERILTIMKDSHIGTYGVIGLIIYELLLAASLFSMPPLLAALAIMAAGAYSKMVTAQLIMMMPYARKEEEMEVCDEGTDYLEKTLPEHVTVVKSLEEVDPNKFKLLIMVTPYNLCAPNGVLELHFVPMIAALGFGLAHHPDDYEDIYDEIDETMSQIGVLPCYKRYCTIDVKQDEEFCEMLVDDLGEELLFYTAEELAKVEVPNPSKTVQKHVGTPSVCEAAAILGSNNGKRDSCKSSLNPEI